MMATMTDGADLEDGTEPKDNNKADSLSDEDIVPGYIHVAVPAHTLDSGLW